MLPTVMGQLWVGSLDQPFATMPKLTKELKALDNKMFARQPEIGLPRQDNLAFCLCGESNGVTGLSVTREKNFEILPLPIC